MTKNKIKIISIVQLKFQKCEKTITYSNDHANRHVRFDSFYCRCEVFYGFKS